MVRASNFRSPAAVRWASCFSMSGLSGGCDTLKRELQQSLPQQLFFQKMHDVPDLRVHLHAVLHQPAGMEHGTVIAAAKSLANLIERTARQLPREIHRHLARKSNVFRTSLPRHISETDVKMLGNLFLDRIDRDR